jgi:site-specific recombinase XerD
MLLSEMCLVMNDYMAIEGLSPITARNYVGAVRRMIDFIGDIETSELTRRHAESYLAMHRQKTSNATIYFDVASIRKFVALAVREGELQEDWSRSLKLPVVKRKLPSAMTVGQATRIINEWPVPRERKGLNGELARFNQIRNRTMMAVALFVGARAKEVTGLDFDDLNLVEDTVLLRNTKGGKSRLNPMHPELKTQLEHYIKLRLKMVDEPTKKLPALFVTWYRGQWQRMTPNSYSTIFKKHVRALGLGDERAHNMRHTFATTLLQGKTDIVTIQHLMGHETLETTLVYLKVDQTMKREAVNGLPIKLVPPEGK